MYVDGLVLLILYVMLSTTLLLGVYNYITLKEMSEKRNRRPTVKRTHVPPQPVVTKKPVGPWGY